MYTALALLSLIALTDHQQTAVTRTSVRAPGFHQVTVQRGIGANVHAPVANININRGLLGRQNVNVQLGTANFHNHNIQQQLRIQHDINRALFFQQTYGASRAFLYGQQLQIYAPPAQIIYQAPAAVYAAPAASYAYPAPAADTYAPPAAQAYYAPAPVQYEVAPTIPQVVQYLAAPTYAPAYYAPLYVPYRSFSYGGYGRAFQFGFGHRHH